MMREISRSEIIREVTDWIGTPYRHQACCKGAGCDCLGLVRGVYGHFWPEPEQPGPYSPDWAEAGGTESLQLAAERYLTAKDIALLCPGDVLLFRYRDGFPAKHAGILIAPDSFVHAQHGAVVAEVPLGTWWRRHLAYAYSFPTHA